MGKSSDRESVYWGLSPEDRDRVDHQNALARAFLKAQCRALNRIRGGADA